MIIEKKMATAIFFYIERSLFRLDFFVQQV